MGWYYHCHTLVQRPLANGSRNVQSLRNSRASYAVEIIFLYHKTACVMYGYARCLCIFPHCLECSHTKNLLTSLLFLGERGIETAWLKCMHVGYFCGAVLETIFFVSWVVGAQVRHRVEHILNKDQIKHLKKRNLWPGAEAFGAPPPDSGPGSGNPRQNWGDAIVDLNNPSSDDPNKGGGDGLKCGSSTGGGDSGSASGVAKVAGEGKGKEGALRDADRGVRGAGTGETGGQEVGEEEEGEWEEEEEEEDMSDLFVNNNRAAMMQLRTDHDDDEEDSDDEDDEDSDG